ncbi:uncharacterized protein LOC134216470 [Armigeres subalbatus]|uniref:uncharacterized protein LOC134216470 n=1 Tax=Armigeres subalbatus TaxID=124917 RepID=UPI002ED5D9A8
MERYEEDIYRLNLRIKQLISRNDLLETQNEKLTEENDALLAENRQLRSENSSLLQHNVQCKIQLEKETAHREELFEANQKHKDRYRVLVDRLSEQTERVKMLEHNLRSAASTRRINHVPVEIIGKVSDIGKNKEYEARCQELQSKCDKLTKDLNGAYAIIDDLEFELESIDYLENENDRLQQEVKRLRSKLLDQSPLHPEGTAEAGEQSASNRSQSPIEQGDCNALARLKISPKDDDTDQIDDSRKSRRVVLHRKLETLHEMQCEHSTRL